MGKKSKVTYIDREEDLLRSLNFGTNTKLGESPVTFRPIPLRSAPKVEDRKRSNEEFSIMLLGEIWRLGDLIFIWSQKTDEFSNSQISFF